MTCGACSCANQPGQSLCEACGAPLAPGSAVQNITALPCTSLEARVAEIELRLAALTHQFVTDGFPHARIAAGVHQPAVIADEPSALNIQEEAPKLTVEAGLFRIIFGDPSGASVTVFSDGSAGTQSHSGGPGVGEISPAIAPAITDPSPEGAPLDKREALVLLEAASGRPIDADNGRVALDIAKTVGMEAEPLRLIGVAARELERSFISLHIAHDSGEGIVRELIASRAPAEQRILAALAIAGLPLSAAEINYVAGGSDDPTCIERLAGCGLIATIDGRTYQVPLYLAHLSAPLSDADEMFSRVVDVARTALDPASAPGVAGRRLTDTEALLDRAFNASRWDLVRTLGQPLAQAYAMRRDFDAWGRVLGRLEAAAQRAADPAALNLSRHDLGVRALVLGEHRRAAAYLRAAGRDRRLAGDAPGSAATTAILVHAEQATQQLRDAALEAPVSEVENAIALAPTQMPPTPPIEPPTPPTEAPPSPTEPPPPPSEPHGATSPGPFRTSTARTLPAIALAVAAIAILIMFLRPHPNAEPQIAAFVTAPTTIAAGSVTQVCVEATNAAVVEIFPDADRLPASGRNCVAKRPGFTTTYVAVATAADGRQTRREVTVVVASAYVLGQPRIALFSAHPTRIKAGESTRLCYAVSGANLLRMVPQTAILTRLRGCQTVTLRDPHPYSYTLFATGQSGHVVMRRVRVDVVADLPQGPKSPRHVVDPRLARRAVYQFDATPSILQRGQATSLCVGVERSARGYVTHLGPLDAGITRCYRVRPRVTTVYRLYVAAHAATAVEAVKVTVRPATPRHDVARIDRR